MGIHFGIIYRWEMKKGKNQEESEGVVKANCRKDKAKEEKKDLVEKRLGRMSERKEERLTSLSLRRPSQRALCL